MSIIKNFFVLGSMVLANTFGFCQENAEAPIVKIILDTDMGSDCDDVGAMALLHEYVRDGKAQILGVIYSSGAVPYGVGIIDAINRYYGNSNIPIGANYDSTFGDPIDKMQAQKLARDTAAFKNRFIRNTDVPEQTQLLRRLLAGEPDNSIVYITIGHTKGLYDLLRSKKDSISDLPGLELARKKLKRWVALGALRAKNAEGHYTKDWNFFFNGTAPFTDYLVKNFPKPIFFVDGGSKVLTGKSLIATPNGNIVRTAYRDWLWNVEKKVLSDQRPSWDLVAVCFAIERAKPFFEVWNQGFLDFQEGKGCSWKSSENWPNHNFVTLKDGVTADFSNYLNAMIAKRGLDKN